LSFLLHLIFITLLLLSLLPILKWYLSLNYVPGSDFFNTGTYLAKFLEDLKISPLKWQYHWFLGRPLANDYPNLHIYLLLPLAQRYGIILAQNYYALASLCIFAVFSYLFFWEISKNQILSAVFASLSAWSLNILSSLIIIGSVTFFASQLFLPLTLYFIEKFRHTKSDKYLYLASLSTGISIYGHVSLGLLLIIPISSLIILLEKDGRLKKLLIYLILSLAVGAGACIHYIFTFTINFLPKILSMSPRSGNSGLFMQLDSRWLLDKFLGINPLIIFSFALTIFCILFTKKSIKTPYWAAIIYLFIYNLLLFLGLNPLAVNLNWPRSFIAFPILLPAITLYLLSQNKLLIGKYLKYLIYLAVIIPFLFLYPTSLSRIKKIAGTGYVYPGFLSKNFSQQELTELKQTIIPKGVDASATNSRLYSIDDRVNMWWNAIFDIPQVRGYYPGDLSSESQFYLNQIDISLLDNILIEKLGTSKERAENIARFYIDWFSIRYIALTNKFTLSSYINSMLIKQNQSVSAVNFVELQDSLYSPIIAPTNSPTLCILGSNSGYNYLMRGIARLNLNSAYLIPIKGPRYIEDLKKDFIDVCDSFILYDFGTRFISNPISRNKSRKLLEGAIKSGKSVYIETGESKTHGSSSSFLAYISPISITKETTYEKKWEIKTSDNKLINDINIKLFSPPIWEDNSWKFSSSKNKYLKDWAFPILENHGDLILAEGNLEKGRVIWSGMNLPFHMDYHNNDEEAKLFRNIISEIIGTTHNKNAFFETNWVSPEKREINVSSAKGIIFKENIDGGWHAKTKDGRALKIYPSGPNYPGFMYVKLPNSTEEANVTFHYTGSLATWFYYLVSLFGLILVADKILLNGRLITNNLKVIYYLNFLRKFINIRGWWEKE